MTASLRRTAASRRSAADVPAAPRRLKLRQLELLAQLVEHQSLARASSAMSVTQPAATKLLREMESMLGVELFERLPRGMRATAFGEIMTRQARTALAALDRARDEIAALIEGASGSVSVGSVRGATASLLAPAVAALHAKRPGIRMNVLVDAAEIVVPRLREARLDIVLGNVPSSLAGTDLVFEPLLDEPLAVVAGLHHPLAHRRRLRWNDVAACEWIVYPQETALRPLLEGLLSAGSRAEGPTAIETASVVATTMLLERTDMLAVMPRDVAEHYARGGNVKILPLAVPVSLGPIGIVRHRDRELSPAVIAFVDEVRRIAQRATGAGSPGKLHPRRNRPTDA
ncbi:MAG TPA: LysR family transcriptional regulator [Usitatibacter sp.]|jgi:DNA-binding transcriptional LysR family regulator|nr:LysR family transcriptional regulator [Usitatibacter sp.]